MLIVPSWTCHWDLGTFCRNQGPCSHWFKVRSQLSLGKSVLGEITTSKCKHSSEIPSNIQTVKLQVCTRTLQALLGSWMYDWLYCILPVQFSLQKLHSRTFPGQGGNWAQPFSALLLSARLWHLVFVLCHEDNRKNHRTREEQKPGQSEDLSASRDLSKTGLKPWNISLRGKNPHFVLCLLRIYNCLGAWLHF